MCEIWRWAGSNSHTVAARGGCTLFPLSTVLARYGDTHLRCGGLDPAIHRALIMVELAADPERGRQARERAGLTAIAEVARQALGRENAGEFRADPGQLYQLLRHLDRSGRSRRRRRNPFIGSPLAGRARRLGGGPGFLGGFSLGATPSRSSRAVSTSAI